MRKIVVLACIMLLLVPAVVLVGCGGGGSSSQTPEQATKAFFAAYQNQDANTTWNLLSAESQKAVGSEAAWEASAKQASTSPTSPTKFTVGKVTVNGNKATAEVTGTVSGKTSTASIPLVKENGSWKVDLTKAKTQ